MWTEWRVLSLARSYIEKGWCKRALARDRLMAEVAPYSQDAVAWCAVGAIERAIADLMGPESLDTARDMQHRASDALLMTISRRPLSIPVWNDQVVRNREEVLAAFTGAMALVADPSSRPTALAWHGNWIATA